MERIKNFASFIIPTYNAGRYLKTCMESIKKQTFREYEVIIVDGGSVDNTLNIVESYKEFLPIQVFKNKAVDAESGKKIGILKSRGDIFVLLDSDNEIIRNDWLEMAMYIFQKHPNVWGVESPWVVNKNDILLNQYFSMLKIADPVARVLSVDTSVIIESESSYDILRIMPFGTPVMGANGFFWRRSSVFLNVHLTKFEEMNQVACMIMSGNIEYARLKCEYGIFHYYCTSLLSYIGKRSKIARKFMFRKMHHEKTWVDVAGTSRLMISAVYNVSVIGPCIEGLINMAKTRNIAWVYHPVVSFVTVVVYGYFSIRRSRVFFIK